MSLREAEEEEHDHEHEADRAGALHTPAGNPLAAHLLDQAPEDVAAVERQEREEVDQAEREADDGEQDERLGRARAVDRLVGDVAGPDDARDFLALLRRRRGWRRRSRSCGDQPHRVARLAGRAASAEVGRLRCRRRSRSACAAADFARIRAAPRSSATWPSRSTVSVTGVAAMQPSVCFAGAFVGGDLLRRSVRARVFGAEAGIALAVDGERSCRRASSTPPAGVSGTTSPTVWLPCCAPRRKTHEEDREGEHDVDRRARRRSRRSASRPAGRSSRGARPPGAAPPPGSCR